ncbi:MAG: ATP-binding cassette domain-containing protein [Candidatus Methanomethylophilaceae archaeon]
MDDVPFSAGENRLFAFPGPNGAGKGTAINVICTLLDHDKGEIVVDGHLVGKENAGIRKNRAGTPERGARLSAHRQGEHQGRGRPVRTRKG